MSFSCDIADSEYECIEEDRIATTSGRCCECHAEIAPGHHELVAIMVFMHEDGPFDDLDDEQRDEVLQSAIEHRHCERCGDLVQSLWSLGMTTYFGELWDDYRDWLAERSLSPRIAPIKYRPNRRRS